MSAAWVGARRLGPLGTAVGGCRYAKTLNEGTDTSGGLFSGLLVRAPARAPARAPRRARARIAPETRLHPVSRRGARARRTTDGGRTTRSPPPSLRTVRASRRCVQDLRWRPLGARGHLAARGCAGRDASRGVCVSPGGHGGRAEHMPGPPHAGVQAVRFGGSRSARACGPGGQGSWVAHAGRPREPTT